LLIGDTFAVPRIIPRATARPTAGEASTYPHHAQMYKSSDGSYASSARSGDAENKSFASAGTGAAQAEVVSIKQLQLPTGDLVYDSVTRRIYASVLSAAGAIGNTITPIDPMTATLGASVFVGSEPGKLALSDDNRQLYVALDGAAAVRRFDMNSQTPNLQFSLGNESFRGAYYVEDIEVLPGSPASVAISRMNRERSFRHEGVAIYDDGVQRPTTTADDTRNYAIEFTSSPSTLYGSDGDPTFGGFYTMSITDAGVTVTNARADLARGLGVDMQGDKNGLLYSTAGKTVNPVTQTLVGTFDLSATGIMVAPDSSVGRVYFLTGDRNTSFARTLTVRVYDQNTYQSTGSFEIKGVTGLVTSFIRWGANGLAFATSSNQVFILQTSLIPSSEPIPTPTPTPSATPTPTPTPFVTNIKEVRLEAKDLIYDKTSATLFASVPGATGNTITAIDPASATVGAAVPVGSEPNKLARSDDGRYLYVGLDGASAVRRFDIATRTAGLQFALKPAATERVTARDIAVMPGAPETIAVSSSTGDVVIYDNGLRRPKAVTSPEIYSIEFSATADTLYGLGFGTLSSSVFHKLSVDSSGVAVTAIANLFDSYQIEFDNNLIYSNRGYVVDPETQTILGKFPVPDNNFGQRIVAPDSSLGRVFVITSSGSLGTGSPLTVTIYAFDARTFLLIGSVTIPGATGIPTSLVRWGDNGLAFNTVRDAGSATGGGQVFLITSDLVSSSGALPTPTPTPMPTFDLTGRVAEAGGAGIGGANINVMLDKGAGVTETLTALTNSDGGYAFNRLPGDVVAAHINVFKTNYVFDPPSVIYRGRTELFGTRIVNFTGFLPSTTNRKIAFANIDFDTGFTPDIFVIDDNGNNRRRLTTDAATDYYPAWSPDGSKILFSSNRTGDYEIFVMNADGTSQTNLTKNAVAFDVDPAWSPDGSQILFVRGIGSDSTFDIYAMNADGSNQRLLIGSPGFDGLPEWSPDGSQIVFQSTRDAAAAGDANTELYVANADGSNQRRLTNTPAVETDASWSPDGLQIAFTSNRDNGDYEIYFMNRDGTAQQRLTNTPGADIYPTWSPDGASIAFASNRRGNFDLYALNLDSGSQRQLTNNPGADYLPVWQRIGREAAQAETKAWTRDNRTSAFVKLTFPGNAYEVADWGRVVRSGNNFVATGRIEKIAAAQLVRAQTTTAHIYDLGTLAAGSYSFTYKSNDTPAQVVTFTVGGNTTPNSIDDAREFARSHYLDFLARDPDDPGLNFWAGEVSSCGAEARCLDFKRVNVSGSFFLSQEFQTTGYFIYRLYKGGLGRAPYYSEFLPAVREVASGIVINNRLSAEAIDRNKAAFARGFVERTDFRARHENLGDAAFVDKLFQTTGIAPTSEERTQLINELSGAGTPTERRARVLFRITDGTRSVQQAQGVSVDQIFETRYGKMFYDREYNPAFVQMQYFGYLRRDPDAAGFNFWLGKLNGFGNFIDAEMVRSFILAAEYRSRFGQP
jgi:dipeptidyl aminopeptidase/acylaminoacyl peptidase